MAREEQYLFWHHLLGLPTMLQMAGWMRESLAAKPAAANPDTIQNTTRHPEEKNTTFGPFFLRTFTLAVVNTHLRGEDFVERYKHERLRGQAKKL